jgi:ABC-2 type transport system ATP-binding protein
MIEIQNLTFGYKKNRVLFDQLNLNLPLGNIYGLLGKNGAGKTTLLKNITGLLFPQQGLCKIGGRVSAERSPEMLSEMYLIPEEFELPALSGLVFAKIHAPFYPKFDFTLFENYLSEFQVDASSKLNRLSFGQKKKFLIAFGLATRTQILVLDEPTNGLDIPSKSQFRKVIASSMDEERCILISTHQVRDLASLIDHVIILDNGKVIFYQSTFEISSKLAFGTALKTDTADFVYAEDVMGGKAVIRKAANGNETEIDLELLFNGVISNNQAINQIFNA